MTNITYLQELRESAQAQAQEHELLLSEQPNNSFFQQAAAQARNRVQEITADLIVLQKNREKEIIEVRLIGRQAVNGSLPLEILSKVSATLAESLHQVSKYALTGLQTAKRGLMDEVKAKLDLRLAKLAPGSTRLFITGQTNPDLFGNSLLADALERSFNILEVDEPTEILDRVSNIGHASVVAIQKFLRSITDSGLEVEMSWDSPQDTMYRWQANTARLVSISSALGQIQELAPKTFEFTGTAISLSLKGVVELKTEERNRIIASYPNSLLGAIQELHVGQLCYGTVVELTVEHTTTGVRKSNFVLTSISPSIL
ncbi:hypothetical protein [Hymenobacter defluvii]|uniref:Uncharacterized protein n=1 Tax=Hymenobacter defluvii TaxID=2054411 RepID=A0ABS3TJ38_9BACT|nr:hypothetical protein [Hymenobacter defluvii]MBO3273193.1 hypothetical protein [Hymenobacter defluvii]